MLRLDPRVAYRTLGLRASRDAVPNFLPNNIMEPIRYFEDRFVLNPVAELLPWSLARVLPVAAALPDLAARRGRLRIRELRAAFGYSALKAILVAWARLAEPRFSFVELRRMAAHGERGYHHSPALSRRLEVSGIDWSRPLVAVTGHFSYAALIALRMHLPARRVVVVVAEPSCRPRTWLQRRASLYGRALNEAVERLSAAGPVEFCPAKRGRVGRAALQALRENGVVILLIDLPVEGPHELGSFVGWRSFPCATGPARLAIDSGAQLVAFAATGRSPRAIEFEMSGPIDTCNQDRASVTARLYQELGVLVGRNIEHYEPLVGSECVWSEPDNAWTAGPAGCVTGKTPG